MSQRTTKPTTATERAVRRRVIEDHGRDAIRVGFELRLLDDLAERDALLRECENTLHNADDTWGPSRLIAKTRASIRALLVAFGSDTQPEEPAPGAKLEETSMAKFREKPVVIEATQWFKNGDHPEDRADRIDNLLGGRDTGVLYEGEVVRYFRRPDVPGDRACEKCDNAMHDHGWIENARGGHTVCPGDFIITGVQGERYPREPDIFDATYEPV